MRYPTDTTLAELIRTERLLPGRLAHGAHGTVRLDATGYTVRERIANAVRSVLPDAKVYADGPMGCTALLDEADGREWLATNRPKAVRPSWDFSNQFLASAIDSATREAADRIQRTLAGLRVRVAGHGVIVVRVAKGGVP